MTVISKFIPVDPDNLPDEEVLAINDDGDMLVGYFYKNKYNVITCRDGLDNIEYVTAYIPVSQLVELYKQGS